MTYSSHWMEKIIAARQLVLAGLTSKAISEQTGLTYKQIRGVTKELTDDIGVKNKKTRCNRSGASIIQNVTAKIHATSIMVIYRELATENISDVIDIEALNSAYLFYSLTQEQQKKDDANSPLLLLLMSDAWSLAHEYTKAEAMFEKCCDCGITYFVSINQTVSDHCPFCCKRGKFSKTAS